MTQPPRRTLPPGLKMLVVEENMIIALDVEDMLTRHGAAGVDVAATRSEALGFLANRAYDAALLDLKLEGGDTLTIAVRLTELGIPFLFATGYGERATRPAAFPAVPMVGKPFSESHLILRLRELLDGTGSTR